MRKYMNIINRLLFGAVALAALFCTGNFETYNRNPDQPSTIDRDVWNYIKSMQYNVIPTVKNQYQIVENVSGGAYGRYFAYAKSTDAGWNTGMFAFYRIANDWANPPYEVPMTNIYSNWRAIKAELEEPEDDYRMALAQIIRVAAMQRVTDIQGPIPYRTMENNDDLTAPYQSQEAVYGFMLEDLDHAVNVLETYITLAGTDVVAEAASADYVYNGNLAKWIRFANSLKLRLAMRISNVSPDAERYAEEAVAHPYGVIESNADNASLDVSQTNDQNPLRWLVEDYSDVHAAAEIVTYMKSFDDPRLSKYFNPAVRDSEYHGSRVGAYSSSQWKDYYSLPKTNALDRLMWMNAAEVAFLKAEMAVNGWDVTGDAKTLYEEGIRLSFEQYQAENYTSYIAGTAAPTAYSDPRRANNYTPGTAYSVTVAWDGALSAEKQREKIITQKWIALYPLGTEAWAEQRRTGYPRFYPTPTSTNASNEPNLPTEGASRIPFAPNEQTRNADNYDAAVALLGAGGDKFGTRLWWDVKTDKPAW